MQKFVIRKDVYDEIMGKTKDIFKSRLPKYIQKIPNGKGGYKYIYEKNEKQAVKKVDFCTTPLLNCNITNAKTLGEKYIINWGKKWKNGHKCESLNGMKVVLDTAYKPKLKRYGISVYHLSHKGMKTGGKLRKPIEIYSRARLLPVAEEILTDKKKGIVTEVRQEGNKVEYSVCGKVKINNKIQIVCVVVSRLKPANSVYISTINKAMPNESDIAVISDVYLVDPITLTNQQRLDLDLSGLSNHFDKAVETSSTKGTSGKLRSSISDSLPKHTSNISQFAKKSTINPDYNGEDMLNKSLAITDKLFNLWTRRLSPELQKEMQKYLDDNSRVYSLFSVKDVYDIKGYPKGQDLENCELMEFSDTYFIISCGGDWQDEKLVKFSIGDDDKLRAEVVDKCKKEDRRLLKKKIAYIINPSELNKSLTYSGHKLQGRTKLYGMDISIENKKGSYRSGTDKDGHKWHTYMNYDYGYIRETVGTDSDHVDCYIGSDKDAKKVYIIHQNDPVTHKYDEDKCMLCFSSAADAKKAYRKQYDRPGFYGSMTTMTVDEFKSYVFSHLGKKIHKSFDIQITDITENNRQQKFEQFEKALNAIDDNKPFIIKHIPADNSKRYENLTVRILNFDRSKIEKAVHSLALTLDTKVGAAKGEAFTFKAQEELTNRFVNELTEKTKAVYNFVISYFGLPEITVVSKANLTYKGKIIYNSETGEPIQEKEWKKFVEVLEQFLNRNYNGVGERIALSSEALGRILARLSETNSLEKIKKKTLSELSINHRNFDWISQSSKNMADVLNGSVDRWQAARIEMAIHSAAIKVSKVTDNMRNDIQDVIINGIINRNSKAQVSQNLFDKCVGLNRDFQRFADSEIQNITNNAYLKEEVYNTKEGEKVYFKRYEMLDDNTCKKCKKIKGEIALWSNTALPNERIKDEYAKYAIWEGKETGDMPVGILHPYCRGFWFRYYPEIK